MSVQTFGMASFRRAVSKGMELAAQAESYIQNSNTMEMLIPGSLGIVCFRGDPGLGDLDEQTLDTINKKGLGRVFWEDRAFISSTMLRGKFSLRLCIVNYTTTWDDVRETLEAIERIGNESHQRVALRTLVK